MKNKDILNLQYLLNKQFEWIKFADAKASIFISVIVGLLGLVFSKNDKSLRNMINFHNPLKIISFIILLISIFAIIIGILYLFSTLIPRLTKNIKKDSNIFFGDISKKSLALFKDQYKTHNIEDDFLNQIYINANIVNIKMKYCNRGIIFISIGYSALIILLILLKFIL